MNWTELMGMIMWTHLTARELGSVTSPSTEEGGGAATDSPGGLRLRLPHCRQASLHPPDPMTLLHLIHFILQHLKHIDLFTAYVSTVDCNLLETGNLVYLFHLKDPNA